MWGHRSTGHRSSGHWFAGSGIYFVFNIFSFHFLFLDQSARRSRCARVTASIYTRCGVTVPRVIDPRVTGSPGQEYTLFLIFFLFISFSWTRARVVRGALGSPVLWSLVLRVQEYVLLVILFTFLFLFLDQSVRRSGYNRTGTYEWKKSFCFVSYVWICFCYIHFIFL